MKEQVQSNQGTKVLFHLLILITVYHQNKRAQELKQSRNLETGADVEAVDRCCIQACLTLFCFFLDLRTTSPEIARPIMGRALFCWSLLKNVLWDCLHLNIMETFSELRFPHNSFYPMDTIEQNTGFWIRDAPKRLIYFKIWSQFVALLVEVIEPLECKSLLEEICHYVMV